MEPVTCVLNRRHLIINFYEEIGEVFQLARIYENSLWGVPLCLRGVLRSFEGIWVLGGLGQSSCDFGMVICFYLLSFSTFQVKSL